MRAYSIFDDFPKEQITALEQNGISVTVHEKGVERPVGDGLKKIVEQYDIVIIGTGQKITPEMLDNVNTKKIIATASIGTDHVIVPENKQHLITVVNAPCSNRISVAEHVFGLILTLKKQIIDGRNIAALGMTKNKMKNKPHDLYGATIGVIGAGGTGEAVLNMAKCFGMERLSWTRNSDRHKHLADEGVKFVEMEYLLKHSDVISINLPLCEETTNLISAEKVELIRDDAVFITVSRAEVTDNNALFKKARENQEFLLGMDMDANKIDSMWNLDMTNVIVTPHIGGGTVESRNRLFDEVSTAILKLRG